MEGAEAGGEGMEEDPCLAAGSEAMAEKGGEEEEEEEAPLCSLCAAPQDPASRLQTPILVWCGLLKRHVAAS